MKYKIENLIASDEGKSILLNGNIIPFRGFLGKLTQRTKKYSYGDW